MTEPVKQYYCLRWNNHHSNVFSMFEHFYDKGLLTDVRLACEGVSIKCHKLVLAACSPYFKDLFEEETNHASCCRPQIIVLKDSKLSEIKAILDYMYRGVVNVAEDELAGLLKAAETLKVGGLAEDNLKVKEAPHSQIPSPVPIVPSAGPDPDLAESMSNAASVVTDSNPTAAVELAPPKKRKIVGSGILPIQWHLHNPNSLVSNTAFSEAEPFQQIQSSEDATLEHHSVSLNADDKVLMDDHDKIQKNYASPRGPYKGYSETDVQSALIEVFKGRSPLNAARMFNIPSRTFYERVKNFGIQTPTSTLSSWYHHDAFSVASLPSQPIAKEGMDLSFRSQSNELLGNAQGTAESSDCIGVSTTAGAGLGCSEDFEMMENAYSPQPLNLTCGNFQKIQFNDSNSNQ